MTLYFLLLKDRKTRYVWVRPVAKKSDAPQEFVQWLAVAERQTKKSVLMLHSDRGGEFLGKQFTDFVNGKGIVHDLTCPYIPQHNGMAEREMRTVVESAVWVRNCLERSTLPPGTTPYQLLTEKKPDLTLARVWGCMAQFLVPEQQRGGKLKPKAKWGLHLGVSQESKGWELLDIADNRVVTTSDVVFYETMSPEVWKSEHEPTSGRTPTNPPTDTSMTTLPLLAEVGELVDEDAEDVRPPSPPPAPPTPLLIADLEEQAKEVQPTLVKPAKEASAGKPLTGEKPAAKPTKEQSATGQSAGTLNTGEKSAKLPTVVHQDAEGSDDGDDQGE
ncbi:unnamed protein product [Closterium sp. NIES-65]|nr:unnamed protein product [Closterium sp. NIES-65]